MFVILILAVIAGQLIAGIIIDQQTVKCGSLPEAGLPQFSVTKELVPQTKNACLSAVRFSAHDTKFSAFLLSLAGAVTLYVLIDLYLRTIYFFKNK